MNVRRLNRFQVLPPSGSCQDGCFTMHLGDHKNIQDLIVPIILCPGVHDPALTADFWAAIESVTLPNTQYCSDKRQRHCTCPPNPPILGGNDPSFWLSPPRIGGRGGKCRNDIDLTERYWLNTLVSALPAPYIFPDAEYWGFSPAHILRFLHQNVLITQPLVMIGFSAGVVGMAGAAWAWQQQGGTICALIALDGWGAPLYGAFPIYRLSHDGFTHWSSQALGMGQDPFYAEPGVPHLDLWRSPQQAWGWWRIDSAPQWVNAAIVVRHLLSRHSFHNA